MVHVVSELIVRSPEWKEKIRHNMYKPKKRVMREEVEEDERSGELGGKRREEEGGGRGKRRERKVHQVCPSCHK